MSIKLYLWVATSSGPWKGDSSVNTLSSEPIRCLSSMEFKSVKGQDEGPVDPQLLFQRLVTTGLRCDELEDVFSYELCAYPHALFESRYCMRQAQKASLRTALCAQIKKATEVPSHPLLYVLDGGALLHRIPWTKGSTWTHIFQQYVQYVTGRYSRVIDL